MLPISELVGFAETLDDSWGSALADAAARPWGLERPRFVRSSASHVFVAPSVGRVRRTVLRLRPASAGAVGALRRGAVAARAWNEAGGPFVDAVPSARGELVEVVGGYAVTALARAEGETLESSGVTGTTAFEWGQTLARLHGAGSMSAMPLLPSSEALLRGDDLGSETAAAVADVSTKLLGLPRGPDVYGVLHGDPESDNVVATDDGLLFIDPDEVRLGWFVSDVVFALRDWADPAGGLAWTSGGIPAAFLAGYRSVRPLTGRELSWVPLLSRAAGLEELGVLRRLTAHPRSSDWPEWALTLDGRLRQRASSLQTMLTPSPSGRRR